MAENSHLRDRAQRAARQLRLKLHGDLLERVLELHTAFGSLQRLVGDQFAHLEKRLDAIEAEARRASEIGRHIYDEEPANRRRLNQLRQSDEYELAFTEAEPLVTFIVPTYNSFETLRNVALPSILDQDYSNLEVIVSGDCSPPETATVIAELDDPRIVYINRTIRGPYSEDPARGWYPIGGPPVNDALAIARGRWIATLGDDDAVRPNHTRDLVAAAQQHCYESCYGLLQVNFAEGGPLVLGEFPPRLGQWGLQSALYHSGLRFFEAELSDAIYEEPSDWSKCRRMIRAGVRFGMIDKIVADKHEWRQRSAEEWQRGSASTAD